MLHSEKQTNRTRCPLFTLFTGPIRPVLLDWRCSWCHTRGEQFVESKPRVLLRLRSVQNKGSQFRCTFARSQFWVLCFFQIILRHGAPPSLVRLLIRRHHWRETICYFKLQSRLWTKTLKIFSLFTYCSTSFMFQPLVSALKISCKSGYIHFFFLNEYIKFIFILDTYKLIFFFLQKGNFNILNEKQRCVSRRVAFNGLSSETQLRNTEIQLKNWCLCLHMKEPLVTTATKGSFRSDTWSEVWDMKSSSPSFIQVSFCTLVWASRARRKQHNSQWLVMISPERN